MQQYGPPQLATENPPGSASRLSMLLEQWLRVIAEQVACESVGLWLFDSEGDADRLRCLARHDARHGPALDVSQHDIVVGGERLFQALSYEVFGVDGSGNDALQRLSMNDECDGGRRMACAFSLNGRLLGAFICSQPTAGSYWSQRQLVTLARVSSTVALSLSRDGETALDAFFKHPRGVAE